MACVEHSTAEIVFSPQPFSPRVETLQAEAGCTIGHILGEACRLEILDPQDLSLTEVYLDGERLQDRQAALDLVPLPGQLLNVVVLPLGGGRGGGSKVLSTVLEIALIAATAWVAGPAGAALGNSLAGAGGLGLSGTALTAASAAIRVGAVLALTVGSSFLQQPINAPAGHGNFEEFGT